MFDIPGSSLGALADLASMRLPDEKRNPGNAQGGAPEDGTPEDGTPEGGTPEGGTPEGGTPSSPEASGQNSVSNKIKEANELARKAKGSGKEPKVGRFSKLKEMSDWRNIFDDLKEAKYNIKADTASATEDAMELMWQMLLLLIRMLLSLIGLLGGSKPAKDLAELEIKAVNDKLGEYKEELEQDINELEKIKQKLAADPGAEFTVEENALLDKYECGRPATVADVDRAINEAANRLERVNNRTAQLDRTAASLAADNDAAISPRSPAEQLEVNTTLRGALAKLKAKHESKPEGKGLSPDDLAELSPVERQALEANGLNAENINELTPDIIDTWVDSIEADDTKLKAALDEDSFQPEEAPHQYVNNTPAREAPKPEGPRPAHQYENDNVEMGRAPAEYVNFSAPDAPPKPEGRKPVASAAELDQAENNGPSTPKPSEAAEYFDPASTPAHLEGMEDNPPELPPRRHPAAQPSAEVTVEDKPEVVEPAAAMQVEEGEDSGVELSSSNAPPRPSKPKPQTSKPEGERANNTPRDIAEGPSAANDASTALQERAASVVTKATNEASRERALGAVEPGFTQLTAFQEAQRAAAERARIEKDRRAKQKAENDVDGPVNSGASPRMSMGSSTS